MKVLCWLALGIVCSAGVAAPQEPPPPPRSIRPARGDRKALVIGNAAYRSVNALKNPGNDANDLGDVLNSLHFQVTRVHDADSSTLRKSVNDFAGGLHAGDIAVFFFAGHGMEVDGANYLVPVDFAPSNQADAEHDCYRADRARES